MGAEEDFATKFSATAEVNGLNINVKRHQIFSLSKTHQNIFSKIFVPFSVKRKKCIAMYDTGADVNLMSYGMYQLLCPEKPLKTSQTKNITTYSDHLIEVEGSVKIWIKFKLIPGSHDNEPYFNFPLTFEIVRLNNESTPVILGTPFHLALNSQPDFYD